MSSATRGSTQSAIAIAVPLVLDERELAAGVAGAGDQPGAELEALEVRPIALQAALDEFRRSLRRRRRSAGSARRSGGYRRRPARARCLARPRICSAVILPTGSTTPTQTLPGWLLRMHADVRLRCCRFGAETLSAGTPHQRAAELGLDLGQELVEAPGVEHVFEPRLLAVGAVAVIDEHAHDGVGHRHRIVGLDIARRRTCAKSSWPVMPPRPSRNHTPASTPAPSCTVTAVKAMSLVSSSTGMTPPPSKPTLNLRGRPYSERSLRMW